MTVDLATIRGLMRNAAPGVTLVIAPDIYENVAAGQPLEEAALRAVERGVNIRMGPETMEKGAVIVTHSVEIKHTDWAGQFLNKSGPMPPGAMSVPIGKHVPMPATRPKPPATPIPPAQPVRPKHRQRIVDT